LSAKPAYTIRSIREWFERSSGRRELLRPWRLRVIVFVPPERLKALYYNDFVNAPA